MNDLIFETLLAEAQFRLAEKTITGIDLEEAIREVTNEMELDRRETRELAERAKKAPTARPVLEDDLEDALGELGGETDEDTSQSNSILFKTPEELDTAVGVLMYKGIAWASKSSGEITFGSTEDVSKAKEALNRRWEFISSEPRVVARIDFDNLEDYSKVLDFIASKRMGVVTTEADLEADVDVEISEAQAQYKKAKKAAKAAGEPAPEEPSSQMSFQALHKDGLIDAAALDVLADESARAIHVVKRWK